MNFFLGKGAIKAIHDAIGSLFTRAKVRFLGKSYGPKRLVISATTNPVGYRHDLSLPGIFESSCRIEGMAPRDILREHIVQTAEAYLDATEAKAQAQVIHAVKSFITDAELKGVEVDPHVVLGGELSEIMRKVKGDVERIVATETTRARNLGTVDSITKVNTLIGVPDPIVCFIPVKDQFLCDECKRVHLMPDGVTPRVYRLSEVSAGYHKKGTDTPCMSGLHPRCRCTCVTILPGYGFGKDGKVTYITHGYDIFKEQRGE